MSYKLNGPRTPEEANCHLQNVILGLRASSAMDYLWKIEDSEGKLPSKRNSAYNSFLEAFRQGEEDRVLFRGRDEFAANTLYDVLDSAVEGAERLSEIRKLLEEVVDASVSDEERLRNSKKALAFFRAVSHRSLINSEYPNVSIPPEILELARR